MVASVLLLPSCGLHMTHEAVIFGALLVGAMVLISLAYIRRMNRMEKRKPRR